jgi:hypothetical protein
MPPLLPPSRVQQQEMWKWCKRWREWREWRAWREWNTWKEVEEVEAMEAVDAVEQWRKVSMEGANGFGSGLSLGYGEEF